MFNTQLLASVAYHEVAHAVIAQRLGIGVDHVGLRFHSQPHAPGYCLFDEEARDDLTAALKSPGRAASERLILQHLVILFAGPASQARAQEGHLFPIVDAGGDIPEAGKLAAKLTDDPREQAAYIHAAIARAKEMVSETATWRAIEAAGRMLIGRGLLSDGRVDGEEMTGAA